MFGPSITTMESVLWTVVLGLLVMASISLEVGARSLNETDLVSFCKLNEYRRQTPNLGYHVACAQFLGVDEFGYEEIAVAVLRDSIEYFDFTYRKRVGDCGELHPFLIRIAEYTGSPVPSIGRWKVFEESSHRLRSVDRILEARIVFVSVNGFWMYPGKYVGYNQYDFSFQYELITMSLDPLIFYIPKLVSADDIQQVIEEVPTMTKIDAVSKAEVSTLAIW
jgi:hypothetical protein